MQAITVAVGAASNTVTVTTLEDSKTLIVLTLFFLRHRSVLGVVLVVFECQIKGICIPRQRDLMWYTNSMPTSNPDKC